MTYRWRVPTPLRYAVRPAAAVVAGLCLWLAFPGPDVWWLAPVGVALLAGATLTAGARLGAALGLVAGLAFFVPVLSWSGVYVGALPWFALATLEALYVAAMSAVVGYAASGSPPPDAPARPTLLVPLAWVVQEWARGATPYGGFPWARLAFSQADSPLGPRGRWLGAPGVTFAVAAVGTLLLVAVDTARPARPGLVPRWPPSWPSASRCSRPLAIAAAHRRAPGLGRLRAGQRAPGRARVQRPAPRRARQPRRRHRAARHAGTRRPQPRRLARELLRHRPVPQPRRRGRRSTGRVAAVEVPLLIGAVLAEPPGFSSNVSLFYLPGVAEPAALRQAAPGALRRVHPEPGLLPDLHPEADLAGNFVAGHGSASSTCRPPRATYVALPTICFEVAYDGLMRDSVDAAGRRREPARRADQQRDLRLHRRVRAAVRDLAGSAPSSTAGRSSTSRRSACQRLHRPRRNGHRQDRRCSPPTSGWRTPWCAPSAPRPTGSVRSRSGSPPPRSSLLLVGSASGRPER